MFNDLLDITRLGASDRIMSGESTFMVECRETSAILRSATPQSLVILDELGRGTATFDGYAVAYAVLRHLTEKVNCRMLFATHYHPLTQDLCKTSFPKGSVWEMGISLVACCRCATDLGSRISLWHMAAIVGKDNTQPDITVLYKLKPGACPSSYGLKVAALAGIPDMIRERASVAAAGMS